MCEFEKSCNPELQRQPSEEHPFGSEWVYCKKAGGQIHCQLLKCTNKFVQKRIDAEMIELAVELYLQNKTAVEIAKQLHVSSASVINILKNKKIYKPRIPAAKALEPYKYELVQMYGRNKMRYEDITRYVRTKYNISICCISLGELIRNWKEEIKNERN